VLEPVQLLSPQVLSEIAALEIDTVSSDGGRLKLEWPILRSRTGERVEDFLWREEGRLVGFLGIYDFSGHTVEIAGMVHPSYRRRGIGAKLLDESLKLCRNRGSSKLLLVAPRNSPGARSLAERHGGFHEHSEHALDLNGPVSEGPSDPLLTLRQATKDDIPRLARILEDAFAEPWSPSDVEARGASTYVGERSGMAIATLRVHRSSEEWGIYGFAVEPEHQGQGVGRDLLRRICRQAKEAGVPRLHLEVEVDNDRALTLYSSLGFTPTSTEDYFEIPL